MRRFRAIVNIQAVAPTLPGLNNRAFDQTASRASCANSSALCSLAPDRRMKVLMRGAKCSNSVANASRSPRVATASIRAAHRAASDVTPLGVSFTMPPERSDPPTRVRREYRIATALARAPLVERCRASVCISTKRQVAGFGSPGGDPNPHAVRFEQGTTCQAGRWVG